MINSLGQALHIRFLPVESLVLCTGCLGSLDLGVLIASPLPGLATSDLSLPLGVHPVRLGVLALVGRRLISGQEHRVLYIIGYRVVVSFLQL